MKKIIFYSQGAYGHVNPTLNVARELKERGYKVIYYSLSMFKNLVEETGITFKDYNYVFDIDLSISRNVGLMGRKSIEITRHVVPGLLEQAKKYSPDLIIHDGLSIWGKAISQKLNIPAASLNCILAGNTQLFKIYPKLALKGVRKSGINLLKAFLEYQQMQRDFGLKKENLSDLVINKEPLNLIFSSAYLHPCPQGFDNSFKFVGASIYPRKEKNDFIKKLKTDKKIVYISLGTVVNDNLNFYKFFIDAFADSEYQVVLSLGKRFSINDLDRIPDNIIVSKYINQLDMLQHADVFISHGGMNGINESLYFGVPLVMIPDTEEQTALSLKVQSVGAGICLDKNKITKKILLESVYKILINKNFYTSASKAQKTLHDAGGYIAAADEIEKYIEKKSDIAKIRR